MLVPHQELPAPAPAADAGAAQPMEGETESLVIYSPCVSFSLPVRPSVTVAGFGVSLHFELLLILRACCFRWRRCCYC